MKSLGKVFIIGDSYSTFQGVTPEDCLPYYRTDGTNDTDVDAVEKTWWHQLITETGSTLLKNTSYSGSTISFSGYEGDFYYGAAFTSRFDNHVNSRFFVNNAPDTVIVFGGTNDSWAGSPIGELKYENWDKKNDFYEFAPSLTYLFHRIKTALPDAYVVSILNSGLKPEINQVMEEACRHYGIKLIKLGEADKGNDHPTAKGMTQIKNMILAEI